MTLCLHQPSLTQAVDNTVELHRVFIGKRLPAPLAGERVNREIGVPSEEFGRLRPGLIVPTVGRLVVSEGTNGKLALSNMPVTGMCWPV